MSLIEEISLLSNQELRDKICALRGYSDDYKKTWPDYTGCYKDAISLCKDHWVITCASKIHKRENIFALTYEVEMTDIYGNFITVNCHTLERGICEAWLYLYIKENGSVNE